MKYLFVEEIQERDGMVQGFVGGNKTVFENLRLMYSPEKVAKIIEVFTSKPAAYAFDKFSNFVVFFQYQNNLGWSMKVTDYGNNTDIALDEYLRLQEKDWLQDDRQKIMSLFQRIQQEKPAPAEMRPRPLSV